VAACDIPCAWTPQDEVVPPRVQSLYRWRYRTVLAGSYTNQAKLPCAVKLTSSRVCPVRGMLAGSFLAGGAVQSRHSVPPGPVAL